jgi:hypothetical protein
MKRVTFSAWCSLAVLFAAGQPFPPPGYADTQATPAFYLHYSFAGLGSNMGKLQPVIRVKGNAFVYTYEQNSYYGKPTIGPEQVCTRTFRQSSIDSILALVKGLGDTTIRKFNPCIMSGGIYYMSVSNGKDTVDFDMMNTFHPVALKIVPILNSYVPVDKKIWASESLIKDAENCEEMLWGKKRKKKTS